MSETTIPTTQIVKGELFKIRWNFVTEDGAQVNRTCTVYFTGVTSPSENGISYEIMNNNSKRATDLTADELASMYVTTGAVDSFSIQVAS